MFTVEITAYDDPSSPPLLESGPHPDRASAILAAAEHIAASPSATDRIDDDGSDTLTIYDTADHPVATVILSEEGR